MKSKMTEQVLTIEEMRHLQELGLQLKETMLYWAKPKIATDATWVLNIGNVRFGTYWETWEYIPAYTLQDILDALPKSIDGDNRTWLLETGVYADELRWFASYSNFQRLSVLRLDLGDELIDAAYGLLCWTVENGYIETNKTI